MGVRLKFIFLNFVTSTIFVQRLTLSPILPLRAIRLLVLKWKFPVSDMLDSDHRRSLEAGNFTQIEDVIDARKKLGHYNVHQHPIARNNRCFHPMSTIPDRNLEIRFTESEITVLRVSALFGSKLIAERDMTVPGDGTHLGENPSMVNLATLVSRSIQSEGEEEYLVPLSSWDSFLKDNQAQTKISKKCWIRSSKTDPNIAVRLDSLGGTQNEPDVEEERRRPSWAGKFSNFCRRHWRQSHSVAEAETPDEDQNKPQNWGLFCSLGLHKDYVKCLGNFNVSGNMQASIAEEVSVWICCLNSVSLTRCKHRFG